jgi:transposase InsO family protein
LNDFNQVDKSHYRSGRGDTDANEHWFLSITDAKEKVEVWRNEYNKERPHSSLNDLTPYEFFKEQNISLQNQRLNLNMAHTMG